MSPQPVGKSKWKKSKRESNRQNKKNNERKCCTIQNDKWERNNISKNVKVIP